MIKYLFNYIMTVDQNLLNQYFGTIWHQHSNPCKKDTKSGKQLIDKIMPGESVLDVGCGTNPFKGVIPNLIGIDPAFEQADFKVGIDEFETTKLFDVALCLGSINFGDREDIERQISKVISLVKPGGRVYWRCNPGRKDHPSEECNNIPFYSWSISEHVRLADLFKATLVECCWEEDGRRLYAEWQL